MHESLIFRDIFAQKSSPHGTLIITDNSLPYRVSFQVNIDVFVFFFMLIYFVYYEFNGFIRAVT